MHLDALRDYCLAKPAATEDLPFGPDTLTFKVGGKMFALLNLERLPHAVVLKCEPERTLDLRERFEGVGTGPYFTERQNHWSYVGLQSDVSDAMIRDLVDRSYDLVVAGLPRRERDRLGGGAASG